MLLTMRMFLIIEEVKKRNPDGSLLDLDQLIERVDYDVTKQAIQHTLRYMVEKGVVEKAGRESRRGRSRVLYKVTELGYQMTTVRSEIAFSKGRLTKRERFTALFRMCVRVERGLKAQELSNRVLRAFYDIPGVVEFHVRCFMSPISVSVDYKFRFVYLRVRAR